MTLHPLDLATNKVLALVGRVEPRDFIDTFTCDQQLQPLGYLAWAAAGKDPGFSPASILEHAARAARYADVELAGLDFATSPPDAATLSRAWHAALDAARSVVALLPVAEVGRAVLDATGLPFRGSPEELRHALAHDSLRYPAGRIRGAMPTIVG